MTLSTLYIILYTLYMITIITYNVCNISLPPLRFAYKDRRKEQKKKPNFPKGGGPSILVFVKDTPRKGKVFYALYIAHVVHDNEFHV